MEISPELFLNSAQDWAVMYFEDKDEKIGPHFYVLIPTIEGQYLIVCIITSKVAKQRQFYAPIGEDQYLVEVGPEDLSCLSLSSIVVCPKAQLIQKEILLQRIANWNQRKSMCGNFPDDIKRKISFAIKNSIIVPEEVKELLIPDLI